MRQNVVEVVVAKEFRDRYSGKTHKPGEKLKITDARRREILRSGEYVQLAPAGKNK